MYFEGQSVINIGIERCVCVESTSYIDITQDKGDNIHTQKL